MTNPTTTATDTTAEYEATVITRSAGLGDIKQTTSGGAKVTAAWLRALADEIDPTRPTMRGTR